jgi:hypothetical protein
LTDRAWIGAPKWRSDDMVAVPFGWLPEGFPGVFRALYLGAISALVA